MLFVRPGEQGGRRRAGPPRSGSCPADGDEAVLATVAGHRPADLERAVRLARHRSAACRCSTSSDGRRGPDALAPLPAGVHAVRFDATAPAERDRAPRRRARPAGPRDARRRPPGGPRLPSPPGPDRVRLPRRPGRPARLRLRVRGRADRADRDPRRRPPCPGRRPPPRRRRAPRERPPSGCRAPRARRWRCSSGPDSASRASRCSSAGRARSPTSAATCRSRPACSDRATGLGLAPPRLPRPARPVVASGATWLHPSARARSPARSRPRSGGRRTEPRSRS